MERTTHAYSYRWRDLAICVASAIAVASGTLGHGFVNIDNSALFLTDERVLLPTFASLGQWQSTFFGNDYQPIIAASFALNTLVGGPDPIGFHIANIAMHALVTGLVYVFVRQWIADGAAAVIGTLFFALHPLRMESVAWVSGRAYLFCAFFILVSFQTYRRFRLTGSRVAYALAFALTIGASLSHAIAAPYAIVLVAHDRLVMNLPWRRTLRAALPFLLAGIVTAMGAAFVQFGGGMPTPAPDWSVVRSVTYPFFNLLFYVWKTVFPAGLSAIYPYPEYGGPDLSIVLPLSPVIACVAIFFIWRATKNSPELRFSLVWMLAFLAPVILWLPTGSAFAADRFATVSAIGLALAAAIGSQALLRWRDSRFSLPLKMGAAIALALMGMTSAIRGEVWKDGTTLWKDVVSRFPRHAEGYNQLGSAVLEERGDMVQAEGLFTQAVTLDARLQTAYVNRALTRARLDRTKDALEDLSEALRLDPMDSPARMARAAILRDTGRSEEALRDITAALALEPTHIPWRIERVLLLLELGRAGEATVEIEVLERSGVDVQLDRERRTGMSRRE